MGGSAASVRREAHKAQMFNMLQTWQSDLSPSQSQRESCEINNEKIKRGKKAVTQEGTRTCDLANDLPCSNQLSYLVIR